MTIDKDKYYKELGCSEESTLFQIRAEYKVRCLQLHPDKHKIITNTEEGAKRQRDDDVPQESKRRRTEEGVEKTEAISSISSKEDDEDQEAIRRKKWDKLQIAYTILSDIKLRKEYDLWRRSELAVDFDTWRRFDKGGHCRHFGRPRPSNIRPINNG
eukprot:m.69321 g.69321  ORF g.69321 m.69321 type:complete len:157 (-) comp12043_c0_seq2:104-574(-)